MINFKYSLSRNFLLTAADIRSMQFKLGRLLRRCGLPVGVAVSLPRRMFSGWVEIELVINKDKYGSFTGGK